MRNLMTLIALTLAACATSSDQTQPAPWQHAPLRSVPQVYRAEWERAANRSTCALVAFSDTAGARDATPRRANFSGGWAVAYDTPSKRSAFGIAGTGTTSTGTTYEWPNGRKWSDGSTATWGLEGGTGPNYLAYVHIAGQDCLYNVWSAIGEEHLVQLIEGIRLVE